MNLIFWGLILLFLDINLFGVSITPLFLGCILIIVGMAEQSQTAKVTAFTKALPWVIAGIVLGVVFWLPWCTGWIAIAAALAQLAIQIAVTYFIMLGIQELEAQKGIDLKSGRLRTAWRVLAVVSILTLLPGWLFPPLAVIMLLAVLAAVIAYIVVFFQCKKALYWGG